MSSKERFIFAAFLRLFGTILSIVGIVTRPLDGALIVVGGAIFIEGLIIYWKEY